MNHIHDLDPEIVFEWRIECSELMRVDLAADSIMEVSRKQTSESIRDVRFLLAAPS